MLFELTREFLEQLELALMNKNESWLKEKVCSLHAADIVSIINELDKDKAIQLFHFLDEDKQADVLMEVDEDLREEILSQLSPEEIAEQVENLDSDEAADLISELPKEQVEEVISKIEDDETAEDIVDLLNYDPDTAGGLMQKEYLKVHLDWSVKRCVIELRKQAENVEKVYTIYVVDEYEKLKGILSLKKLLIANPSDKIKDIYKPDVIYVKTDTEAEEVANIMDKYDLVSIPVVDLQHKLVGRITIDDIVDVIRDEADKDFQMASGISENIESNDSVWKISRARMPWLIIGMGGGVLSAQVISGFEGGISKIPALAFFIPLITAMGGNVGVQSSAIVVQSLARGNELMDSIFKKITKEVSIALLNGAILSSLIYWVAFVFENATLGLIVSLSLFSVIIFAGIFGTLIPLILHRYKIDPALATGPFITTMNDVAGLFIYFSIGMLFYGI